MSEPTLIVTLGGTMEPIDAVRVITNLSRGALGRVIVATALERGLRVHALVSELATPPQVHDRLTIERFTSALDLQDKLRARLVLEDAPVAVAMAAAVADYRPEVASAGKISSEPATRTLHLVRNPKLIDAIHEWRADAILVSFKLGGDELTPEELLDKAARQRTRTRSEAVVANYWPSSDEHRAWFVTADGARPLVGRAAIASAVVDLVLACFDRPSSAR